MIDPLHYERLLNSPEFKRLYTHVSESNARFRELPEAERKLAVALMINQDEALIAGLDTVLYCRPKPKIEEFLASSAYLGGFEKKLFPYWREKLIHLFAEDSTYYEMVSGGAIGTGKTSVARVAQFFNLCRMLSLREPQLTLNQSPETLLALQLFSVSLSKGEMTLQRPFLSLLHRSTEFVQVRKARDVQPVPETEPIPYYLNRDVNAIEFPRGVVVTMGSVAGHGLGMTLFGALFDEAEFRTGSAEDALTLYLDLKERIRSRFFSPGINYMPRYVAINLVSSAKTQNGVLYNYSRAIPEDDPHTIVAGAATWEIRSTPGDDPYAQGHFYVLRGTQSHPSRILDIEHDAIDAGEWNAPYNTEVVRVPLAYRGDFEFRIEHALQNLVGVQTIGDDQPFDHVDTLPCAFLTPEHHLVAPLGSTVPLLRKLPAMMFQSTPLGARLSRYPDAPRYVHLDLAETTEAGIAIVHKEMDADTAHVVYVCDLVAYITSPDRIDLEAIQNLLIQLHRECGVFFGEISADQYQSTNMRQVLEKERVAAKVSYQSVVTTPDAYLNLATLVSGGAVRLGPCPKLQAQLESLYLSKNKIYTRTRKDMADALAGAVRNAQRAVKDYPSGMLNATQKQEVADMFQGLSSPWEV